MNVLAWCGQHGLAAHVRLCCAQGRDENDAVAKRIGQKSSKTTNQLDPYSAMGWLRDKFAESGPIVIGFDSSQEKTVPVKSHWTRIGLFCSGPYVK